MPLGFQYHKLCNTTKRQEKSVSTLSVDDSLSFVSVFPGLCSLAFCVTKSVTPQNGKKKKKKSISALSVGDS